MYNTRIAITPSGVPHLGNNYIFLINYILKNKILGNIILRFDDTNQKKNKILNKFFIIKNLKKNGIFIKNVIKQTNFVFFYIKKKIINKKICFKKIFINNKIKKKNLSYSITNLINNCKIFFFDNNFKFFKFKINFYIFPFFRKNFIPVYNYSSLIDDFFQNIFIILRGKEWLNQIPFQLILLKKFKLNNQFNHLPNINYLNNKKLSKRNKVKLNFNNIFIFFKKKNNFFKNNKDFKLVLQNKKKNHTKKINNFIMINLLYFIKNLSIENFAMFLKSKILYLKDLEFKINFSNLDFFKKIFENLTDLNINDKISLIIKNIKNYEFI
ncbi:glutamate--tRNA ligase family protein [Candidatus Carsonella ruddii]|uniref:Glutamate--tRNA ligase family protein n=1 Tax=Carsonella ruddii TaxID=114186 RepID=A0AAJ6JW45_CARRU|nr:glutamate--tRNA ligase family protein [Candidatus Carsonella ruddii]WGS67173.1 glutamate--tRNA ligase family protein [Candidatus Carsonella ruddii]